MSLIKKSLAAAASLALATAMAAPAFAVTVNAAQTGNQLIHSSTGQSSNNGASINTSAFENVSGNVGVNVAGGNDNQQLNVAHIDNNSPNFVFSGDYEQSVSGTYWSGSVHNTASITDQAFGYAAGNIGVNVAAGNVNQQQNAAFIVADDSLSSEIINGVQNNYNQNFCTNCDSQSAGVSGNAFAHASGNIGVNVTAGNGNQQMNSLTLASTNASQNTNFQQTSAYDTYDYSGNQNAYIADNAFNHVDGNVGVNVSAGNGNSQLNRAEVLLSDSNGNDTNTIGQTQYSVSANAADNNTAAISGNAFQNATGNIGVNLAAGNGNQQANSLTVNP